MNLIWIWYVYQIIFQDTKIEDILPIILQANLHLILGLAPQQKPNLWDEALASHCRKMQRADIKCSLTRRARSLGNSCLDSWPRGGGKNRSNMPRKQTKKECRHRASSRRQGDKWRHCAKSQGPSSEKNLWTSNYTRKLEKGHTCTEHKEWQRIK